MSAGPDLRLLQHLVSEEVRRAVADGIAEGGCLSAGDHAARIHKAYPAVGLTRDDIYLDLAEAAARAGVAVELGRPWATSRESRAADRPEAVQVHAIAKSSGR
jgi:hypothetical protein